jgi:hypothetical protein
VGLIQTTRNLQEKENIKWRMPSKGSLQYRFFTRRSISLSSEPAVQANEPKEMVVPANHRG